MKSEGGFFSRLMKKVTPKDSPNSSTTNLPIRPGFNSSATPSGTIALGLRLLSVLNTPNSVISASGVHLAMQLGASAATKGSVNAAQFRALLGNYNDTLVGKDGPLTTATALYFGGEVLPTFVESAQRDFGAHVAPMPSNAEPVNAWVKEATHGKVNSILDELPAGNVAILLSAVHFAAPWREAFDPNETEDAFFYPGGDVSEPQGVRMMYLHNTKMWYGCTKVAGVDVQVLEMPYAEDGFAGIAILPGQGSGLDSLVQAFGEKDGENAWMTCMGALHYVELGSVGMPRFKVEFEANLNDALKKQGLKAAFEGDFEHGAFNCLTAEAATVIKDVLHKATIECTEKGTVAAAATAVTITRSAKAQSKPEILLDRPFLFAVRKNDELLFICRVDSIVSPPVSPESAM